MKEEVKEGEEEESQIIHQLLVGNDVTTDEVRKEKVNVKNYGKI